MTTTPDDSTIRDTLARLQDSPRAPGQTIAAWLDAHKDDVISLSMAKGIQIAQDLLGLHGASIYDWRRTRHLDFVASHLSRDGSKALVPQNIASPRPPKRSTPVRGEPAEPPAPDPAPPTHVKRDSDRIMPTLRRADHARYIIMEDGRVLDVATGQKPQKEAP